jgi:single-strand DNA-binding protein
MVNKVMLLGRVGSDPEGKQISEKFYVASLSLATSEKFMKDGTKQEVTEWHRVKFFNKLAQEVVMKYVKKGDLIHIEGKIHYSKVEKDGKTTYFTEINADEMKMIPTGKQEATPEKKGQPEPNYEAKLNKQEAAFENKEAESDDLPF